MDKFTQKWCVAAFIEPVVDGYDFFWKDVPLHVTIVGVFGTDKSGNELSKIVKDSLNNISIFEVQAGEDLYWGENKELVVVKINNSEIMQKLADAAHFTLSGINVDYLEPEYEGEEQVFHSAVQKHARLNSGDIVQIKSVSIVDMFPNSDGYRRKIFKTFNLGNNS